MSPSARRIVHWAWFPVRAVAGFIARSGKRIAVTVVGFALMAAGLVFLVLPGPGLLLMIAGLAVLATEYVWAQRALNLAKQKARQAKDRILGRTREGDATPEDEGPEENPPG